MIQLRDYQLKLKTDIGDAWAVGFRNVLAVAPTGSGKTAIMSDIVRGIKQPSIAIAHRQELVSQISLAMARVGVYHNIIAPRAVIKFCISRHVEECGKNYHHANAPHAVAGVQTILRRATTMPQWCNSVGLWMMDEGHHVLPKNSWGKASLFFPNAYGLGVTASPIRCDKQPLGRVHKGMFDHMVSGPSMRDLIIAGYLADYRIFAPAASIDRNSIKRSKATGDFTQHSLREEAHNSTITGDIVEHYLKIAPGKRGITFTVDVDQAVETAARYNNAGVPADCVSAKTPDKVRQNSIRRFERGDIKQLVNVDLFGEGFDVPAVEVVSMGRPTESFGLYLQQFGRALRPLDGKPQGVIIDHVGNVMRHGLPDAYRAWSLDIDERGVRGKRDQTDVIPVRVCEQCFSAYEAITTTCPYCGHVTQPKGRSQPEFVDGDLVEFSQALLSQLRGQINNVVTGSPAIPHGATPPIVSRLTKLWDARQVALAELRDAIELWAGIETTVKGRTISEAYRVFYHTFGVDVLTAQTRSCADMQKLTKILRNNF